MAADQYSVIAGAVAQELLGEPNRKLSSKDELRFGNKGSVAVDLKKGVWSDHSSGEGGGVIALVERETGRKGREAVDWLKEHGFHIESDRPASSGSNKGYSPRHDRDEEQAPRDDDAPWKPKKTWDYVDENKGLIFQVVRLENGLLGKDGKPQKTYRQRKPDASKQGGWDWSTKGVRQVPYRLPELMEYATERQILFIVEGEKAADKLLDIGIPATTNARGAGKWVPELNEFFAGCRVVVLADDDPQAVNKDGKLKFHDDGSPVLVGLDHANEVARNLHEIASEVKVLKLHDRQKKEDVVDWFEQGGTIEDLYEKVKVAPKWSPAPFKSRFNAISWSQLDDAGPQHEFLIKGLLTRGENSIVGGASQAGKSFLIVDIGMAVARGIDWMGRRVRRGLVVYQAGEGQKGIKKRLKAYRLRNGLTLDDDLPFVLMPAQLNLFTSDDPTLAFIDEVKHWEKEMGWPVELIIIDTFAKAITGANENDGRDVGQVLERCMRISHDTGAHVCLVHHMNAEGHKLRGHTSILANLENVLIVTAVEGLRDDDKRQIREVLIDKQKDGERGGKVRFVLEQVVIGRDEDGDPVTSCIVASPTGETSEVAMPERANVNNSEALFIRALQKATDETGTPPPLSTNLPRGLRLVEWKAVVKAYDSLSFDTDDSKDTTPDSQNRRADSRRKAMTRAGESLLRKGIIGREKPWVWLTGRSVKGMRNPNYSSQNEQGGDRPPRSYSPPRNAPAAMSEPDVGALWGED